MAEIELKVLSRIRLDQRIVDVPTLGAEVAAWRDRVDAAGAIVDWRFTTDDRRIQLNRLYP